MFSLLVTTILSVSYSLIAVLFGYAGYSYVTECNGLHPMLAFPVAALCLVIAVVLPIFVHRCEVEILDQLSKGLSS